MTTFYVATDASGTEHRADGAVQWNLPDSPGGSAETSSGHLLLRSIEALVPVLDERIFEAKPVGSVGEPVDGVVSVTGAVLSPTAWNEIATVRFAFECAEHAVGDTANAEVAPGHTLGSILADAKRAMESAERADADREGFFVRLGLLHRLRQDRVRLGGMATGLGLEDGVNGVDVFDDVSYESLTPVIDAVLAAIEALREHLYPRVLMASEAAAEEREAHDVEDRATEMRVPQVIDTPLGSAEFGGPRSLTNESTWLSARNAALHGRTVCRLRSGESAGVAELAWQSSRLGALVRG